MESRLRILFLTAGLALLTGCSSLPFFGPDEDTEVAEAPEQVIEPEVERREIVQPKIDTVDSFQGKEMHVVIFSCVRASASSVDGGASTRSVLGAPLQIHVSEVRLCLGPFTLCQ